MILKNPTEKRFKIQASGVIGENGQPTTARVLNKWCFLQGLNVTYKGGYYIFTQMTAQDLQIPRQDLRGLV